MSDWEEKYLYMVNSAEAYPPITVPDNPIMSHQVIQSLAERVCEVLAREVDKQKAKSGEEFTVPLGGVYSQGIDVGLRWATQTITRPRDWTAILSENEEP